MSTHVQEKYSKLIKREIKLRCKIQKIAVFVKNAQNLHKIKKLKIIWKVLKTAFRQLEYWLLVHFQSKAQQSAAVLKSNNTLKFQCLKYLPHFLKKLNVLLWITKRPLIPYKILSFAVPEKSRLINHYHVGRKAHFKIFN